MDNQEKELIEQAELIKKEAELLIELTTIKKEEEHAN